MKKITISICFLASCCFFSVIVAQNCKPDLSKLDKITKQQHDEWFSFIYTPGFLNNALNNSNVKIGASILREGDVNKISVILIRTQEKQNTANVQQYKAVKGTIFYFGLKDGSPLKLVADEVNNFTDVVGEIGVHRITLYSYIKDEDLKTMLDQLTTKTIEAVRVILENDITIEQSVKEKDGVKMMSKYSCFFNFAQEKGYIK